MTEANAFHRVSFWVFWLVFFLFVFLICCGDPFLTRWMVVAAAAAAAAPAAGGRLARTSPDETGLVGDASASNGSILIAIN